MRRLMRISRIVLLLTLAASAVLGGGCAGPLAYRQDADCEVSCILQQQGAYPQWYLPETSADIPLQSRNFDPAPPDCPPMPPDDPVAHRYMHCPSDQPGYKHWHAGGDAIAIESSIWRDFLTTNDEGQLELSYESAFDLGIVHNRRYQTELENVYLTALQLTFERFEFDVQWFGGNTTEYRKDGPDTIFGERNEIATSSLLGFNRNFAAGGQLLVNLANRFVWEFTGSKNHFTTSNLVVDFVQPLLRGAFRDIRLENLTQAERNVLYAVRDFARFRKQFYVDLASGDQGYLDLLLKLQAIRNFEQNLVSLEENLRAHESLAEASIVNPLQVDQVFQSYQAGRLALIRARNNLENSLDSYKIQLGIPPEFPVKLDDSKLDPFEVSSPEVTELEIEINELLSDVRNAGEDPDAAIIDDGFRRLTQQMKELVGQIETVDTELERWEQDSDESGSDNDEADARDDRDRRLTRERLDYLRKEALNLQVDVDQASAARGAPSNSRLERLVRSASNQVADLFVMQTQIRTYLIQLETIEVSEEEAVDLALRRRLDLLNQRAIVVDSWRRIRVAQDALEADLDLFVSADIGTEPNTTNPVDFSSDASSYRVGVALDGPLNRLAERNNYRAQLIDYQRARRDLIGQGDVVVQAVRRDLRALEAEKLNFEISRQSLVTAARQVEFARVQLLAPGQAGDSSTTQDALNALNSLLAAKNSLVASWVAYETARLQLLLDIESLDLDQYGQIGDDDPNGPPGDEARVSDTVRSTSWQPQPEDHRVRR
jgi:outer membrane protein TolC